jgi:DNA-binding HxlR family transcriptional regulator
LTAGGVEKSEESAARAGAGVLSLLAVPLNGTILEVLSEEPVRLVDLRRRTGSPPPTTLRARLRVLNELGAISGGREAAFPGSVGYELTPGGRDLLRVAQVLNGWLSTRPDGRYPLGSEPAKAAIKALVEGWTTSMLRVFASGPFSLTQVDSIISGLNYPSLERRLVAMRLAGLVEPVPSRGRGTPYAATEWLRRAAAPLTAAMWWERRHLPAESPAIMERDVEALFLLGVPLLPGLLGDLSGSCRLAVELGKGERLAGVMVEVDGGAVKFCSSKIDGYPDAWVVAPAGAWLGATIEHRPSRIEICGELSLARGILRALRQILFFPQAALSRAEESGGGEEGTNSNQVRVGARETLSDGKSREKPRGPLVPGSGMAPMLRAP